MEIAKFRKGERGHNPKNPEPIDKKLGMGDYIGDDSPHAKTNALLGAWRHTVFSFPILLCDPKFCSRPETKP